KVLPTVDIGRREIERRGTAKRVDGLVDVPRDVYPVDLAAVSPELVERVLDRAKVLELVDAQEPDLGRVVAFEARIDVIVVFETPRLGIAFVRIPRPEDVTNPRVRK